MKQPQRMAAQQIISGSNNVTQTNTNTVNINITPYNQPNNYLDDAAMKKILDMGYLCVQDLVTKLHFNKEHPENHNIYISNKKDWMVTYKVGDQWKTEENAEIMTQLYDDKSDFLIEKYNELEKQLAQSTITKFTRFKNDYDNNDQHIKSNTIKELKFILYNNKNTVKDTIKETKN